MKLLAIRFSSLGDIVLTLPALAGLREALSGELRIHYATRSGYSPWLELSPLVDRVLPFGDQVSLAPFIRSLRAESYDGIVDFHGSLRSRLVALSLRAPVWRTSSTHGARRRILKKTAVSTISPVWRQHCETVARVASHVAEHGVPFGSVNAPLLAAPSDARVRVAMALPGDRPAVALLPGARWPTKRWPPWHFARLARVMARRGIVPVVLGSPEEADLVTFVAKAAEGEGLMSTGAAGELLAWLERCVGAVGNDSGLTHLAEAVGTPVVALFGPTVPEFGFGPRLKDSSIRQVSLMCRPCVLHGGERCPLGTHQCMVALSPEVVWETVRRWF